MFIATVRFFSGTVVIEEVCGKEHGKKTYYFPDGRIYNEVYRDGSSIARKEVSASEAFFTRDG